MIQLASYDMRCDKLYDILYKINPLLNTCLLNFDKWTIVKKWELMIKLKKIGDLKQYILKNLHKWNKLLIIRIMDDCYPIYPKNARISEHQYLDNVMLRKHSIKIIIL